MIGPSVFCPCRRGLAAVCLAFVGLTGSGDAAFAKSAPAKMAVAGGELVVAGPRGYCVDTEASHETGTGAFVLLGSCASLANSTKASGPKTPAILTATVSPGAPPSDEFAAFFKSMAAFLASDDGRKVLSRSGKAKTVQIKRIIASDDVLYILASDTAELEGQNVEPDYWRALFAVDGHLVTLSVLALADQPLAAEDKRALLDKFVAKVRAEND